MKIKTKTKKFNLFLKNSFSKFLENFNITIFFFKFKIKPISLIF